MSESLEAGAIDRRRLRYRAERRGLRETEILLGGFFARHGADMEPRERGAFARLLDEADPDIWAWVAAGAAAPPRVDRDLIARLRLFRPAPTS